jgi:hypothetical protein
MDGGDERRAIVDSLHACMQVVNYSGRELKLI